MDSAGFDGKLRTSDITSELRKVWNIKPASKKGQWFDMLNAAWNTTVAGRSPWTLKVTPGWTPMQTLGE